MGIDIALIIIRGWITPPFSFLNRGKWCPRIYALHATHRCNLFSFSFIFYFLFFYKYAVVPYWCYTGGTLTGICEHHGVRTRNAPWGNRNFSLLVPRITTGHQDMGSIRVRVPPDSTKGCDCYFWAFPKGSPVTSWRATGLPFV